MNVAIIVSIVLYGVFSIYIFLGIYVLSLNYKGKLNQLFSLSAFLMSIWTIGFALAASAPSPENALFWRRFSAIGWSIVFSVILQFIFTLVHQNDQKFKLKPLHLTFLYFPTVLNLIIFSFYTPITNRLYHITDSYFGYTNIVKLTYLDHYYNVYYVACVVYSLILLYQWGLKKQNMSRKSAILITSAFIVTSIAGTLTDRLLRFVVTGTSLQVAPLIMSPAIFALYYAVKKHGSFLVPTDWTLSEDEIIINSYTKRLINKYLARFLFIGSITSFIYNAYFYQATTQYSAGHGIGLLSIAMILYLLPHLPLTPKYQDIVFVTLTCIAIPYTLLTFASIDGSITIWIMPLFLIFISVLYSNKLVLIMLTASSLFTYIVIWISVPSIDVRVTGQEHILRVITVLLLGWFAYNINKIYTTKLHENERQLQYQQIMATISTDLLTINLENMSGKLMTVLQSIGAYSGYQRVYFLIAIDGRENLRYDIEWCGNYVPSTSKLHESSFSFNWLSSSKKRLGIYALHNHDIPAIATGELQFIKHQNSKTTILMPVEVNGTLYGYLGMDSLLKHRTPISFELKQYTTFANIVSDAFQKTLSESNIHQLAYYDALTGLPNRTYLNHHVEPLLKEAQITSDKVAILFLDLDEFKHVNDSIGHAGGDALLVTVSEFIKGCLSDKDIVCRYSGDEFIVVSSNLSHENEACLLADRILSSLRSKIQIDLNEFVVTSSIGIAMYPQDGTDLDALIHNADLAMYEAKLEGKNQYKLCSNEDKERLAYRSNLIKHLKYAIDYDEFIVHYQPQVHIKTGDIIGYEALLRWNNSEFGFIPPSVFIPLAEQCGLIKSIGAWVLREVCAQYQRWSGTPMASLPVAVNVSSHQFKKNELLAFIKDTLQETHMDPKLLELEITESVAVKDKENTSAILKEIKSLGVTVAIDDFGTEYSSLSRLKELPIDRIKIAMKFIHGINIDPKDEAIINVIVYLAKKLGLKVIAEGVENKGQVNYLKHIKCDDIQGYYYHKPMPAEDIEKLF